jgi:hypothetical protein
LWLNFAVQNQMSCLPDQHVNPFTSFETCGSGIYPSTHTFGNITARFRFFNYNDFAYLHDRTLYFVHRGANAPAVFFNTTENCTEADQIVLRGTIAQSSVPGCSVMSTFQGRIYTFQGVALNATFDGFCEDIIYTYYHIEQGVNEAFSNIVRDCPIPDCSGFKGDKAILNCQSGVAFDFARFLAEYWVIILIAIIIIVVLGSGRVLYSRVTIRGPNGETFKGTIVTKYY